MGIAGLLPLLKSITETKSIDEYKGRTLAIDGYCWYVASRAFRRSKKDETVSRKPSNEPISNCDENVPIRLHRAIYACSQEICLGQETDKYER